MPKFCITQLAVDWKEGFAGKDINNATRRVGGQKLFFEHTQGDVDCNVAYVSSQPLTREELNQLWAVGDLWQEADVIEGNTFKEALNHLKQYAKLAELVEAMGILPPGDKKRRADTKVKWLRNRLKNGSWRNS
jgi:hypothetical protein